MTLNICLAQLNATVGDVPGNMQKALSAIQSAKTQQADVVVFPELFLSGYPADDLLYRQQFLTDIEQAVQTIQAATDDIYCLITHPQQQDGKLFNTASLFYQQRLIATYHKQCLPNDGVFDEQRHFTAGNAPCVVTIKQHPVGILICEDLWHPEPLAETVAAGAALVLCPNASPFAITHHKARRSIIAEHASVPIVYVNLVGGQDELVFDGASMVIDKQQKRAAQAPFFEEALLQVAFDETLQPVPQPIAPRLPLAEKVYLALTLGLKDYVQKNGFQHVLLGLSGGIDSALSLAIAVDALGADHVTAIGMPSRYTSELSHTAAETQAKTLGVSYKTYSIETPFKAFTDLLTDTLQNDSASELAKQNCQARCRGVVLMTLSNATNALVLTTGNRSELAVGYSTLYGDMAGAFCVLKDVPKTLVYALANYRNQLSDAIPQSVIDRPPSAELAPDQKDQDSLPPYDILDAILELYINEELDATAIIAKGYDETLVKQIIRKVQLNEYKRKQAPPGVRINPNAFGRDRRYPITSKFKE